MYDRFKDLCGKMGKTMKEVCKDLGISQGTVSNWKKRNSTPSGDLLSKMANYFNVSIEYLLTGHEKSDDFAEVMKEVNAEQAFYQDENLLSLDEAEVVSIYRLLPDDQRRAFVDYGRFLLDQTKILQKKIIALSKEA